MIIEITGQETYEIPSLANCEVCGKKVVNVCRTTFYYNIKCECHSPQHFETVYHCKTCIARVPGQTKITFRTNRDEYILKQERLNKIKQIKNRTYEK